MIDRLYGANFWKSTKLNMPLTKLIIDCRDLHKSPNICVQLAVKLTLILKNYIFFLILDKFNKHMI